MSTRALRSPISIVVLGLLAEQPLHPYGIRALMRERGHNRLLKGGSASLYDAATRLANAGLIEVQETTRAGRHPQRTTYRITPAGVSSLQSWVRDTLADPEHSDQFTATLSFMYVLPPTEVITLLQRRADALGVAVEDTDAAIAAAIEAGVTEIFLSEERYNQALRRAQREWLTEFTDQLRGGELGWPEPRPTEEKRS